MKKKICLIAVCLLGPGAMITAKPATSLEARPEFQIQQQISNAMLRNYFESIEHAHQQLKTLCTYPAGIEDVAAITCVFEQFQPVYRAYEQIRKNTVGIDMKTLAFIVVDNDFNTRLPQERVVRLLPFMQEFITALPQGPLKSDMLSWQKRLHKYFP